MAPSPLKLLTLTLLFSLTGGALALTPDPSGAAKVGNGQHQSSIGSQCQSSLDCGANGNTACCAFLPQADGGETIGICSGCGATTQQGKQGCGFGDDGAALAGDAQVCPASSFAGGVLPGGSSSAASASSAANAAPAVQAACAQSAAAFAAAAAPAGGSTTLVKSVTSAAAPTGAGVAKRQQQVPDPTLDAGKGNGQHEQFVTGACVDSRDCGAAVADLASVCCASVTSSAGEVVGVCSGAAVGDAAPKMGCGFGDGKANSAA